MGVQRKKVMLIYKNMLNYKIFLKHKTILNYKVMLNYKIMFIYKNTLKDKITSKYESFPMVYFQYWIYNFVHRRKHLVLTFVLVVYLFHNLVHKI